MKKLMFACLVAATCATAAFGAQTAPYAIRDEVQGPDVALAAFPIRPMLYRRSAARLWAINHLDNTLCAFNTQASGQPIAPVATYPLPWSPVALAFWSGPNGLSDETEANDDEILVVSRGTWAVVSVRVADGRVSDVVQLRRDGGVLPAPNPSSIGVQAHTKRIGLMAEPSDIVVDQANDRAFVSCMGADGVIQIDLASSPKQVVRFFHYSVDPAFECKSPLFLTLEPEGTVLVTPLMSGNNSTWGGGSLEGNIVADLEAGTSPQPDEDLFRITPWTSSSALGSVQAVATNVGTSLFMHALHPNGKLWVLNTEALNKVPGLMSEPDANGRFISQRITSFNLGATGTKSYTDLNPVGIDDPDVAAPSTLTDAQAVGQPFAVAFNSVSGHAFVVGMLTDNLVALDASGNFVAEWDVPVPTGERAIPRGVITKSSNVQGLPIGSLYVYAWGVNRVYEVAYDLAGPTFSVTREFDLGRDPTTAAIRAGRKTFFDGSRSKHKNVSCASCHVEGGSDQLVWNLSHRALVDAAGLGNVPFDDKGGMVTQTMVGLARLAPFHWRGERQLIDFNPAFAGLLGGNELTTAEFDDFQAFVFSLANPANPFQSELRKLDPTIRFADPQDTSASTSNAVDGQTSFLSDVVFKGQFRCTDCHSMPTGTLHDLNPEVGELSRPHRARLKPAAFHELWRKEQPTRNGIALLGAGFFHIGNFDDVFDIVNSIIVATGQVKSNITQFVRQWDSGLGQAVHTAVLVDVVTHPGGTSTPSTELAYLYDQAATQSNCDLVVLGYMPGATPTRNRWCFRAGLTLPFVSENPAFADRTLAQFISGVAAPSSESHVFVGLPRGRGEPFAIDADFDGVVNVSDSAPFDPLIPGNAVGAPQLVQNTFDVLWTTAKTARVRFETDQPTIATLHCQLSTGATTGPTPQFQSTSFSRVHSMLITGLEPSTDVGTVPSANIVHRVAPKLVLTNPAGQGKTYGFVDAEMVNEQFSPLNHITPAPGHWTPTTDDGDRSRLYEHLLASASIVDVQQDMFGVVTGKLAFDVRLKRWATYTGGALVRPPAPNRVVIGRILVRRQTPTVPSDPDRVTVVEPSAVAVLGSNSWSVAEVRLVHKTTGRDLQAGGGVNGDTAPPAYDDEPHVTNFIFTPVPTNTQGIATLDFQFTDASLVSGDTVVFVVDAVVEIDASTATWDPSNPPISSGPLGPVLVLPTDNLGGVNGGGQLAFSQWSFPDTKEANAFAQMTLP